MPLRHRCAAGALDHLPAGHAALCLCHTCGGSRSGTDGSAHATRSHHALRVSSSCTGHAARRRRHAVAARCSTTRETPMGARLLRQLAARTTDSVRLTAFVNARQDCRRPRSTPMTTLAARQVLVEALAPDMLDLERLTSRASRSGGRNASRPDRLCGRAWQQLLPRVITRLSQSPAASRRHSPPARQSSWTRCPNSPAAITAAIVGRTTGSAIRRGRS